MTLSDMLDDFGGIFCFSFMKLMTVDGFWSMEAGWSTLADTLWSFVFNDLVLRAGLYIGLRLGGAITLTFCIVDTGAISWIRIQACSLDIIVGKKSRLNMTYYQTAY